MKSSLLFLTLGWCLSAHAEIDPQFMEANKKYMEAYTRFLHLQKDAPAELQSKRQARDEAQGELNRAQGEFDGIDRQMSVARARGEALPGRISQTQERVQTSKNEAEALKAKAVQDGLFTAQEKIEQPTIEAKIAKEEKAKADLTKKIEDVEAKIKAITDGEEYLGHFRAIEEGKKETADLKSERVKKQGELATAKDRLIQVEKVLTEFEAQLRTAKGRLQDLVAKDLPTVKERDGKNTARYNRDLQVENDLFRQKSAVEDEIESLFANKRVAERDRDRAIRDIRDLEEELAHINHRLRELPGEYRRRQELTDRLIPDMRRLIDQLERDEDQGFRNLNAARGEESRAQQQVSQQDQRRQQAAQRVQTEQAQLAELQQRKAELEREIAERPDLERRRDRLTQEIQQKQQEAQRLEGQIAQAQNQAQQARERAQQARREVNQAENRVQNLRQKEQEVNSELAQAQSELQQAQSAGDQEKIRQAQAKVNQATNQLQRVQGNLAQANQELSQAQAQEQRAEAEVQQAVGQVRDLQQAKNQAEREAENMAQRKANVESRLQQIAQMEQRLENIRNNRIPNTENQLRQAQANLADAERDLRQAQAVLQQRRQDVARAEAYLRDVQGNLSQARGNLRSYENELSDVLARISELERLQARGNDIEGSDLPQARRRRADALNRLARINAALDDAHNRLADLTSRHNQAVTQRRQSETDMQRSGQELAALEKRKGELEGEVSRLEARGATIAAEVEKARGAVAGKTAELDKDEKRVSELAASIRKAETAIRAIQTQKIEPLNQQVVELSGNLTVFERKARAYRDLWDGLKVRLQTIAAGEKELQKLRQEQSEVRAELERLTPTWENLKAARDQKQSRLSQAEQELSGLEEDVRSLPARLRQLEDDNFTAMARAMAWASFAAIQEVILQDIGQRREWKSAVMNEHRVTGKSVCLASTLISNNNARLEIYAEKSAHGGFVAPMIQVTLPVASPAEGPLLGGDLNVDGRKSFPLSVDLQTPENGFRRYVTRVGARQELVEALKAGNTVRLTLTGKGRATQKLQFSLSGSSASIQDAFQACELKIAH